MEDNERPYSITRKVMKNNIYILQIVTWVVNPFLKIEFTKPRNASRQGVNIIGSSGAKIQISRVVLHWFARSATILPQFATINQRKPYLDGDSTNKHTEALSACVH